MRARCVAVVAGMLLAATVASAPRAAAAAEPPSCDDGVTVVVDYNQLGGDPHTACAAAGSAEAAFTAADIPLEFVPTIPGFVCRVDELPATGPCTDGDAYWSLWWSDGSDDWTYATLGVTALEVPEGGYVGFAWHQGKGDAAPPDEIAPATGAPVRRNDDDASAAQRESGRGFPLWAAGGLAALVFGGAAVVPILRRRSA